MANFRLLCAISLLVLSSACAEEPTTAPDGPCPTEACVNGGQCELVAARQVCACPEGFYGELCENEGTPPTCDDAPCENGGTCTDTEDGGYACDCPPGFIGENCEEKSATGPCFPNPCENGGTCSPQDAGAYLCECTDGFVGNNCEQEVVGPGACAPNPCLNEGVCEETDDGGYYCVCADGYTGDVCESKMVPGPCDDEPCLNGGTCADTPDGYECDCPDGTTGQNCEEIVLPDPCEPNPCQNEGLCVALDGGGFQCECLEGFSGEFCETSDLTNLCEPNPCQNDGICSGSVIQPSPGCLEPEGEDDFCSEGCKEAVCAIDPFCCLFGWDETCANCAAGGQDSAGNDCSDVANQCVGGEVYTCECPEGTAGANCETIVVDPCDTVVCQNEGICVAQDEETAVCECADGYTGDLCEFAEDGPCDPNPCENGPCIEGDEDSYACECPEGWYGVNCEKEYVDPCANELCENGGTCGAVDVPLCQQGCDDDLCRAAVCKYDEFCCNSWDGFCAACAAGGIGFDNVDCGDIGPACQGLGFECSCVDGFSGTNCEVPPAGPCDENPCQNDGICSETDDGFTCTCKEGYSGELCEVAPVDPCAPNPCQNNGQCVADEDAFACECPNGFDGDLCENNIDDCVDNACANDSVCIDGIGGYSCDCSEGYAGDLCDVNIDDCDPNPCENNGTCEDGVASFTCDCPQGYEGELCDINPDDCPEDACANGGTCVDGVASYSCECAEGFFGPNCEEAGLCSEEPCANSAACTDIGIKTAALCIKGQGIPGCAESEGCEQAVCDLDPYCCNANWDGACGNCAKAGEGYDGLDCSEVGIACLGGPTGFQCDCLEGYTGELCEENIDDCADNPCQNGGLCVDGVATYTCDCQPGTSGVNCESIDDPCVLKPCQNGGECSTTKTPLCQDEGSCDNEACLAAVCELDPVCCGAWDQFCTSCAAGQEGFGGLDCSDVVKSCTDVDYECACPEGFEGDNCEVEVGPACSDTSVLFDGTNCIVVPADSLSGLGEMTLEFWARVDDFAWFFQSVLVDGLPISGLDEAGFRLSLTNTGAYAKNLHYLESTPDEKSKGFYGKNPFYEGLQENTWTHVAVVRSPQADGVTKISIYVDGAYMIGPTFDGLHEDPSNPGPITIGCADKVDGTTAHFYGAIDELRLSNIARYAADFDPTQILDADENTVLLYQFEDTENPLMDSSSNQLDGKWIGEPLTSQGAEALLCE